MDLMETENKFEMKLLPKSSKNPVPVKVELSDTALMWTLAEITKGRRGKEDNLVYLKDVIAVHEERGKLMGRGQSNEVAVHYITYPTEKILRRTTVKFEVSKSDCEQFMKAIIDHSKDTDRPKRLLVLINPVSGRKKGVKIFRDQMAPLFRLCQIETDVIVVTRRIDAETVLLSYNIDKIDGIVTVGGDGLCCECVNGLLKRFQKDNKVDFNNPESRLHQPQLPVGMIPAGSGNLLLDFLHGTKDLETAMLKIIIGKTTTTNVAGVYTDGKLVIYSALILGFGLCGRMVRDCEKARWLGPSRYNVAPLKALFTRRKSYIEVEEIGPYPDEMNSTNNEETAEASCAHPSKRCKTIKGDVYSIDSWIHTFQNGKDNAVKPTFGDNTLSAYIVENCGFTEHLEHLAKVKNRETNCFEYDFVSSVRGQGYKVRILDLDERKFFLNCDGEALLLQSSEVEVRLHQNAVKLFGSV